MENDFHYEKMDEKNKTDHQTDYISQPVGQLEGSLLFGDINNSNNNINNINNISDSFQLGCDITSLPNYYISSSIETEWQNTLLLFIYIVLGLPIYTLNLINRIRKESSDLFKDKNKYLCPSLTICIIFYLLMWISFGLWLGYHNRYSVINKGEMLFIIIFYIVFCFAESIVKTTKIVLYQNKNIYDINLRVDIGINEDKNLTIRQLTDIVQQNEISDYIYTLSRSISIIVGLSFSIVTEIIRWKYSQNNNYNVGVIIYVICTFILRFILISFVFFNLGETIIHLYLRYKQTKYFYLISSSSLTKHYDLPYIKLDDINNIKAWHIFRASILYGYMQPKMYIDIILSSCSLLWLFCFIITAINIFYKFSINIFTISCVYTCIAIFIYLIICISLAAKTRDQFNHLSLLDRTEYSLICMKGDKSKEIMLIKKIIEIVKSGQSESIIFNIFGFGINKNFYVFIIGLIIPAISTFIAKLN